MILNFTYNFPDVGEDRLHYIPFSFTFAYNVAVNWILPDLLFPALFVYIDFNGTIIKDFNMVIQPLRMILYGLCDYVITWTGEDATVEVFHKNGCVRLKWDFGLGNI